MRVLHTVHEFSPLSETFIYDLVREVAAVCESVVVARKRENPEQRPFPSFRLLAAPQQWSVRGWLDRALAAIAPGAPADGTWRGNRRSLLAALRELRPDVVHAHFGPEGVFAEPVARALDVPLLTSFHGFDASRLLRSSEWPHRYQALWRGRNAVTVVSSAMRDRLTAIGCPPGRVRVVRTGVARDARAFTERRAPPHRFVSVGRFVEKKGHLDAIRAVQRVVAGGERISLRIVGDGPLLRQARDYVSLHGLSSFIHLPGALDHASALRAMGEADAFLLCSRTAADGDEEGVPVVLMEAQAMGLPCVTTRHAGIPEVVPHENHWLLAPEGDIPAIAAAIVQLRRSEPERLAEMSRAGAAHVREHFDARVESARVVALYHELVSGTIGGSRASA